MMIPPRGSNCDAPRDSRLSGIPWSAESFVAIACRSGLPSAVLLHHARNLLLAFLCEFVLSGLALLRQLLFFFLMFGVDLGLLGLLLGIGLRNLRRHLLVARGKEMATQIAKAD